MTTWDELVSAATVGTDARPLAIDALPGPAAAHATSVTGDDPAAAVLDAAALLVAARRAGQVPDTEPTPGRVPARSDRAPELTPLAGEVVARRLAVRNPLLLAALLDAAGDAGRVLPPPLLPALLDAAERDRPLRPLVARVAGERGRWLAGYRAEWAWLAGPAPGVDLGDPEVWRTGGRAARHAHLTALRAGDPAAARELLVAGWDRETGDDRALFVAVLAEGLSLADEPFLEAALDDRKATVRATAARLLATLAGSGYRSRAAAAAAAAVQVRRSVLGSRLVTTPPAWTPVLGRDGVAEIPPPGVGIGAGAWLLAQVVRAAPLSTWGDPARTVALPVEDGLAPEVHSGWRAAAVRERDQRWLAALLAAPPRLDEHTAAFRAQVWIGDAELAAALPPAQRARRVADLLRTEPAALRIVELDACPRPWPAPLADAVLHRLLSAAARGEPITPGVRELVRYAGVGLPGELADELHDHAQRAPAQTSWPATLRGLAATVSIRRTFARELTP